MMESKIAMPREVHLEVVLQVFSFLCQKYNYGMAFDPTYLNIYTSDFKECKWNYFYGKSKQYTPPNFPEEKGKEFDLRGFINSDHGGEIKSRRSSSGFLYS